MLEVEDVVFKEDLERLEEVDDAVVARLRGVMAAVVVVVEKEDGLYMFPAPPRPAWV